MSGDIQTGLILKNLDQLRIPVVPAEAATCFLPQLGVESSTQPR